MVLVTKTSFGSINPYDFNEIFENFLERVEAFFLVNLASNNDKVSSLILLISPEMYAVLKNLMLPGIIKNKKCETVIKKLKHHYCPKQLIISEQYKCNSTKQKDGESVSEFITNLRRLSASCQFDTFLDQALRDR